MSTTIGTLTSLAIYVALVAVGAVIGSQCSKRGVALPWLGKFQFVALMILIVTLGIKLGANDEVIASLGQIGLAALVITAMAMLGSLIAVYFLRRFVLKLDRYGRPAGTAGGDEESGEAGKADNGTTKWIVVAVLGGMLIGYFLLPDSMVGLCGTVIDFGLYLLLFLVGMDMGKQGTMLADIKAAGFKVLLVPAAVVVGTFAFVAVAGLLLPSGVKDSVAASAGFGWYSLAPTLLQSYSLTISATAFLSNVMREIFSIILVPVVARKIGYVECTALAGATAMDTLLPVVVGATHERITIYSFVTGVILSLAVPVLIPMIIALPF
ncbi:MAG: lysine exporter LysO family protein [Oscillospiraceae bacterium]|nr:lysine exporter LysO family protein [Oscillospiraceae bacterium]